MGDRLRKRLRRCRDWARPGAGAHAPAARSERENSARQRNSGSHHEGSVVLLGT